MKINKVTWILLATGVMAFLVAVVGARSNMRSASLHGETLDGSWIVTVTPTPGPSGALAVPPFKALVTFTEDGSLIQTDVSPSPLSPATTGHGDWTKTAPRGFAFTFVKLLSDRAGNFRGTMKVRENIQLNLSEDKYTGDGDCVLLDPNGDVMTSFSMMTQATRIQVELGK